MQFSFVYLSSVSYFFLFLFLVNEYLMPFEILNHDFVLIRTQSYQWMISTLVFHFHLKNVTFEAKPQIIEGKKKIVHKIEIPVSNNWKHSTCSIVLDRTFHWPFSDSDRYAVNCLFLSSEWIYQNRWVYFEKWQKIIIIKVCKVIAF